MVDFILTSTISLGILYSFYYAFLRSLTIFQFNRYYLLFSLFFSLTIPFVNIPVKGNFFPLVETSGILAASGITEFDGTFLDSAEQNNKATSNVLPYIFLSISSVLLLRFSLNLFKIIKQIRIQEKKRQRFFVLVLIPDRVPPHTFLNYILVNRDDYTAGVLDEIFLAHEVTHSRQWHSLDLLFIELLKTVLWINPFIWLMNIAIKLNHEFLADKSVLANHDVSQYKNTLVSIVLKNNGMLVSNFSFSPTKQRLEMMTKQTTPLRAIFAKTAAFCMLFIMAVTISCQQKITQPALTGNITDDWWEPILKEHNIKPASYNNFSHVFEMGSRNSIKNGVVSLENAFFLFRPVEFKSKEIDDDSYVILEAPFATHDLNTDSIKTDNGQLRIYSLKEGEIASISHLTFSKLKMFVNENKFFFEVYEVTTQETKLEVEPEMHLYNMSVRW